MPDARRRNYFRARRVLVATGGTFDELEFAPTPDAEIYHIMRFAVEDETSSPSGDIRVYVKGHGYEHWIMDQESPSAGVLYWERWPTFLFSGESLVARFNGATASDRLVMYLEGWYWVRPPVREAPMADMSEDRG